MAARTWPTKALEVLSRQDAWLSWAVETYPEGATQTFKNGWPVVITSGLVVEAANPVTAIWGFAAEDATGTTGADIRVIPAFEWVMLEANFLAASAANNVLAAADLGSAFQLAKSTTLLGASAPGWYVLDSGSTTAVKIYSNFPQQPSSATVPETRATAGDTNARVVCTVLNAVRTLY